MTIGVNLIGAGRVGRTLARLVAGSDGMELGDVASARPESAEALVSEVGAGRATGFPEMRAADCWFLTVPDTRIGEVAETLARRDMPPSVAVHCSGYHRADVMSALGDRGWRLASAHPNLSFADPAVAAGRFRGTYVGLEGDDDAIEMTERLFTAWGAETFRIPGEAKALYHGAAVVTNNFTTVLQSLALELWEAAGVPDEVARELNRTLLRSCVDNLERMPPWEALTGPAARGDRAVVEAEGAEIARWRREAGEVYAILSAMAARMKETGRALPDQDRPGRK